MVILVKVYIDKSILLYVGEFLIFESLLIVFEGLLFDVFHIPDDMTKEYSKNHAC